MTAPDRIWVTGIGKDATSHWWHSGTVAGATEYIRADLATPAAMPPEVRALVESALEVFADCADLLDEETREIGRKWPDDEWAKFRLLVSDYRRARAALNALRAGGQQ